MRRIKELIDLLNEYNDNYYNKQQPTVSDEEYDRLYDELTALEKETGIIFSNSPTQNIGYEVKSKLNKIKHTHKMMSLDKTKSVNTLKQFAYNKDCILSLKLDGLTILLTYEDGELVQAETRGNGEIGEDITHNAKVFENIPLHINVPGHFEIEGEAIITYGDFENINNTIKNTDDKYKNPRNLASGSVRQLDNKIAAKRHLKFIAWKVPGIVNTSMDDALGYAAELGFDIVPYQIVKYRDDFEQIIDELKTEAGKLGYPIDGLVMTYDDIDYGLSLGCTSKFPKHSIAFKFYEDEEVTILKDIEYSMGKYGFLTPVAIFEPVELAGTIVERASLHNISILTKLDLHIGDEIVVYKANEIIPQIRENLSATMEGRYIHIPSKCPICGGETKEVKENDSIELMCTNPNCSGKFLGKLNTFVSKQGMDIHGLSEATLQLFINKGYITSFKDIYHLADYKTEITNLPKMGSRSVKKLLDSIEDARKTTLDQFLVALSIPNIGVSTAKDISKYCKGDIDNFVFIVSNTILEFMSIDGIGRIVVDSIDSWWDENADMVFDLLEEVQIDVPVKENSDLSLKGKTFCITGATHHFKNRTELQKKIESLGGKVSGSISAKTFCLINNDINSASSKNTKAKASNIPIWTEEQFIEYIN